MGKRQHQKDKMYLTCTEWTTLYGGKRTDPPVGDKADFRRLPFDHCSLSLQPFENPLCSPEGHIFELMNIVPYLKKYGTNPITGKPLDGKSLVRLKFHKNSEGQFHCPVLYKVFNNNSHIVAVKSTGNVFSMEAVEQLNLKAKNLRDLLLDTPFQREEVITLQDPANLEKFNLAKFYHLKNNLSVEDEDEIKARKNPQYHLKSINMETATILDELKKSYKPAEKKEEQPVSKKTADKFNAAHYSTGTVAASFTSTVMVPVTKLENAVLAENKVRYARIKKKGYVSLVTTLGTLNLELHCDLVPKTCENFIKLCQKGYYDGTIFHRSIRNFMIQGGDPTGTGKGGESIWGKPFKDEFVGNLKHNARGILSMANSGPNTNKSQFFITYRSCRHLDKKHTIFGRVVGGLDLLDDMEKAETNSRDKPKKEIKIEKTAVFVDPYKEVDEQLVKDRAEEEIRMANEPATKVKSEDDAKKVEFKTYKSGVGKYIKPSTSGTGSKIVKESEPPSKKKKLVSNVEFKDFSGW